ncbi:uncharacterized protein LOC128126805 [Lactuca sativa]|uniref:uncharacterized protein LOC128126805 n=1 Tax=Lactuca sativa TaxID=4236 RepID=UPI0022B05593|nr:uncharacterized protein LOC128126805 [Lactuca sativa]
MACPYLRCLEDHEALEVLKDIHEGYCGNHTGGKSLGSKVLRTGYYWAMMKINAFLYAKKCDACQRHRNILRRPAESLHPIIPPWPFMKWGMDIIGKLLKALGGNVFIYFCMSWGIKMIMSIPVRPQANGQVESNNKLIVNNLKKWLDEKKGR